MYSMADYYDMPAITTMPDGTEIVWAIEFKRVRIDRATDYIYFDERKRRGRGWGQWYTNNTFRPLYKKGC